LVNSHNFDDGHPVDTIIINRITETGAWATLKSPRIKANADWAERLRSAHANAVENPVIFSPLVITIQITQLSTPLTAIVGKFYFFARVIHLVAYAGNIPVIRTMAFATGFVCQMMLGLYCLEQFKAETQNIASLLKRIKAPPSNSQQ
jgi:uncharacterized MAPEG superfamily protein